MTLKTVQVLELRLENIRHNLLAFTKTLESGLLTEEDINRLIACQLESYPVFRLHVIAEDGSIISEQYELTEEEKTQLAELCLEDGVFSAGYVGKSGRWQTVLAYSGFVGGKPCRVYQESIIDELYLDHFMEFYEHQGYSYMISREDGTFIMLPKNQFGQGLYSGLFAMLDAYQGNSPEVMEEVYKALEENQGCMVQLNFRGEDSFFCFVPVK